MGMLKCAMIGLAVLGTAAMAVPTLGQTTPPSQTYHLRAASTDQEGCFGGCECPTSQPYPMRGTFILTPTAPGPLLIFQNYAITDVNWRSPYFSRTLTGSGTYARGVEIVPQPQQMTLHLTDNQGTIRDFDSGQVPVGSPGFPVIHVHLGVPNTACWNMELEVNATPYIGDWNADGVLQVQDIFDFLTSWFAGDGDANEDGATTLQDVFDFLNGWFAGN